MNPPPFKALSLDAMGALLPAFDFTALLAASDSAAVYLSSQRSLDRHVAIKILAPNHGKDPVSQPLFESTARSMAKLNHPNLIGIYDSGSIERMPYFVMEFVPGKSLARSAKGQPIDLQQALLLVDGICAGLAHAHHHQITHGDLSPSNILLNQNAEPKIGNFGFSPPTAATTRASLRFTAPEVLDTPGTVTPRSDIFATGSILYELLTGQPHGPDVPPPSALSSCGPAIDAVWRQATATDPSQRITDARALQTALKAAGAPTRPPTTSAARAAQRPTAQPAPKKAKKLAPGSTPPASPPPNKTPPPTHKVGFNWKLVRNLCIIVGLVYAISIAWEWRKKTVAQRDRDYQAALALEKEQTLAKALQRKLERAKRSPTIPEQAPAKPEPALQKTPETPSESLARLRSSLASGARSEMPVGSLKNGTSDYFPVSNPMTWPEAVWFAEQHGGHLAIPNASANLTWLVHNLAASQGIWLGAAHNGRNTWALADGSAWKPAKEPPGLGPYLAADKHGFLRAEKLQTKHQFIIQWHRDGSNPGALDALLTATRNSLTTPEPAFPPGTLSYGIRHFLLVCRPLTWREASNMAKDAGGTLAVPAGIAEITYLEEMSHAITAKNGIWLGGVLKGDHWTWSTGEPWKSSKWIDGTVPTTPGSALILRPGEGWDAQAPDERASGFVIEWSNDPLSANTP